MVEVRGIDISKEVATLEKLHGNLAILARLDAILNDPNSALSDAERLINTDGALSATIIRLANSVVYSVGDRRTDVYSALQKVGFNEALRLVGMALSRQVFMRDLVSYGMTAHDYWRDSFYAATLMETIARHAVGINRDRAYLVGLLHGIGKVVINEILLSKEVEILWDRNIDPHDWEEIMVGCTYPEVGEQLLQRWGFPGDIYTAVGRQLDPQAHENEPLVALLHFSRRVISHLDKQLNLPDQFTFQIPQILAADGVDDERMWKNIEQTGQKVSQVSRTLRRPR